jgi:hypothetical protein
MTTAQIPTLADVLNTYCKLAIGPTFANSEPEERRVRNFVLNLQREGVDNDWVYDCLTELNPLLGCPLAFYQEIVLHYDEASKTAESAQKEVAIRSLRCSVVRSFRIPEQTQMY